MKNAKHLHSGFRKRCGRSGKEGFTLVETSFAVMIGLIVSGFIVQNARQSVPLARVEKAASRLSFQMSKVRAEAIAFNQSAQVSLNTGTNQLTWWIDANKDDIRDADEVTQVTLADTDEVVLTSTWSSGIFNSLGQFVSAAQQMQMQTQSVRIRDASNRASETVSIRGSGSITRG